MEVRRGSLDFAPDELIIHILSQLSASQLATVSLVCKNLQGLVKETETNFKNLRDKFQNHRANYCFKSYIRSQTVISLESLNQAAIEWPSVSRIELEKSKGNQFEFKSEDAVLSTISVKFTNLRTLVLTNNTMAPDVFKLTDQDLTTFSLQATRLRNIRLGDCPSVTSTALTSLFQKRSESLESISIDSEQISNAVVSSAFAITTLTSLELRGSSLTVDDSALDPLLKATCKLTKLNLVITTPPESLEDRPFTFSADKVFAIAGAQSLRGLTYFGIDSTPLTDGIVSEIVSHHPQLRGLWLGSCAQLSILSLQTLTTCTQLSTVELIDIAEPDIFKTGLQRLINQNLDNRTRNVN